MKVLEITNSQGVMMRYIEGDPWSFGDLLMKANIAFENNLTYRWL
jgi:hypothetical protein